MSILVLPEAGEGRGGEWGGGSEGGVPSQQSPPGSGNNLQQKGPWAWPGYYMPAG